jgi:Chemotaxis phosphatase CheX
MAARAPICESERHMKAPMDQPATLLSKVLVLDGEPACHDRLKAFCEQSNLVPLKAHADNVMAVLKSNVDLGAIFVSESQGGTAGAGLALGRSIHAVRPELPIFLRRERSGNLDDLADEERVAFRAAFTLDDMDALRGVIDRCIFTLAYPQALVRGIMELTCGALENQFRDVHIEAEAPYVVRDRIIFGELFSLMPLESSWCRGYLLLQTEEQALLDFVQTDKTYLPSDATSFRDVNNVLGELTNLIWGMFKNRFVSREEHSGHITQVPIIVNHLHRYISFGSEDPQLCFRYTLRDESNANAARVVIDQRFVFNLNWAPDNFKENAAAVDALFAAGEVEFF